MNLVLEACARLWQFLRDVNTVLRPCRFSALVVAAGVALLLSGQGLEFTVRLPAEGAGKTVWFHICVFLWAFQSWFWARLILDLTFGDRDAALAHPRAARLKGIIRQTPRVLAAGSYLVAVAVCVRAGTALIGALLAVEAVLFYAFLVLRLRLVRTMASGDGGWRRLLLVRGSGDPGSLRSLPLLSLLVLALTAAVTLAATVWVCSDAVSFGWYFGAAAVPFLGFSMIVPVGSLLVLVASDGGRNRIAEGSPGPLPGARGGYPVITLLVLLAVAFSFFPALDNHRVRTITPAPRGASIPLSVFLDRWMAQAPVSSEKRAYFVVVATAGGGLRAAFWTTTVLGAIQDDSGQFSRQLAGISGVSGGSLGATVFATLAGLESLKGARRDCGPGGIQVGPFECTGQTVLSQDFLAPPVASLLFPDLMQRFVPVGFPDRAQALEQSWERAWVQAGFQEDLWADRGFRSLWAGPRFVPALLLNATHVESGKRVIASPIDIGASPEVFRDAYDLHRMLPSGEELRPSTAAHNSARFTYLSPAGTLPDGTHLVDGGYFENFGAVAARELLKAAVDRFGERIRPIAVLISNDPELEEQDLPVRNPQQPRSRPRETWGAEALSPLRALLHTRDARGLLAASELRALAEQNGGAYFQFRLCKEPGRPDPALGWVLSAESEELMREQLRSDACGNAEQLQRLLQVLRG